MLAELAVAALGVAICAYSPKTARLVAPTLSRCSEPVQNAYRAVNLGHPYDSEFWATYYRYAGAALAILAGVLYFVVSRG